MGPGIAPNGFSLDYCRRTSKSYAWLEMTQTSKGRVLAPLLCLDAATVPRKQLPAGCSWQERLDSCAMATTGDSDVDS